MSLKIISLNIEGNRHLDLVQDFLQREQPDIVCLQEVFEVHVTELAEATGMKPFYTPMSNVVFPSIHADPFGHWGLLQLIHPQLDIQEQKAEYYVGDEKNIPVFFENENPNSINRAVLWSRVASQTGGATVATTHFTWSPNGQTTEEQLRDFAAMEKILDTLPPHLLCGDFNAPRGREIYTKLSQKYRDNIPTHITSTIDSNFHKSGRKIEFVVDGMFTSPGVSVTDVQVQDGVSDHCALLAELQL